MSDIVKRLRLEGEDAMRKHLSMGMWKLCAEAADEIERLTAARIGQLEAALREISEGKGRYSMDQFQHAQNTIEDMKELARAALEGK